MVLLPSRVIVGAILSSLVIVLVISAVFPEESFTEYEIIPSLVVILTFLVMSPS